MKAKTIETKPKAEALLKVESGHVLGALRDFLKKLLEKGIVDYLLVPQEISHGRTLAPTLIKDPAQLDKANPFSPVMPVSSAAIVSKLTVDKPVQKLGVVLKPCEVRALIELVKLQQANLENLVIIGTDCPGTYEVEDYAQFVDKMEAAPGEKAERILTAMFQSAVKPDSQPLPIPLRTACQMCNAFTPSSADIALGLFGVEGGVSITMDTELAEKLGLAVKATSDCQAAIAPLLDKRNLVREHVFAEYRGKMKSIVDFADCLNTCIRCYACSTACPLCYCRVCFFRTDTFEPESQRYYRWADKEGALRMPTEILLYHLTRLSHVAMSCCGCGMCESACPRKLPLTTIFQTVGDGVQKALNYVPGRSVDEQIPLATFREVEV